MANLTRDTRLRRSGFGRRYAAQPLKTSTTFYQGGFYALQAGYAAKPANTAGIRPYGFLDFYDKGAFDASGAIPTAVAGNTSPSAGYDVPTAVFDVGGGFVHHAPVTGASAITDKDRKVFLATDNFGADLTIYPSLYTPAIGRISDYQSATSFDIEVFDERDIQLETEEFEIADVHTTELEGTSAITLFTRVIPFRMGIVALRAEPVGFDASYVAGSQVLSLKIDSTATTGGALTVAYTNIDAVGDMATVISATDITALNLAEAGQSLSLVMAASGTGFTAGVDISHFRVYAIVMRL